MEKKVAANFSPRSFSKTLFINVCIFVVYVIAGKLGLSFASLNPSTSAIWPPTGIALASILLFGYRVIPAIFLGAFVVNITTAGTIGTSLGIAFGNTLEGTIGTYLVTKFAHGSHAFSTVLDIFKFILLAAVLSTTISANVGFITLLLGNLTSWHQFVPVWTTWWFGDAGGDIIIAPLILIWARSSKIHIYFRDTINALFAFFVLYVITWLVFSGTLPYAYICIPITVWLAFWFGRRGATIASLIVSGIGIFYTIHGFGPFSVDHTLNQSLLLLQIFLCILSVTALTFATLVHAIRKGERALASHEARFKALIEKSFEAVVLIEANSNILYASPSVKRVLGYDPEELIGFTGFNLIAPVDRQFTIKTLAKLALKPGATMNVEYRVIRKDKRMIWVEAIGTNLLFDQEINAVVVNFRDITEEKTLEGIMLQEKTTDEAMLKSIGDGIIATDHTGKITMINKSASDTLGWREKDLIGKLIMNAIPMKDETGKDVPVDERPITKVLSLKRKVVTSRKHYYVKKDGSLFPVRFRVTPIEIEGKIVGIIEVFQDITKEKEIDQMKDDFISMASHELRTPMTAINGLLSMIFDGDYGPINTRLKHPLDNIQVSAKRQIHLINDLLDVSRLQSGKIDITISDFLLQQTLDETVKSLMPIAKQKNLTLTLVGKENTFVHADPQWTKNIINNLIGNALKFTDKGNITVSYTTEHNVARIAVTDTGSGIDPQDVEKLFGKFQQLNGQLAGKPPGSGLGLFLSRELARKMNGDIELAKSTQGMGSTFVLTLPKAQAMRNTTNNDKKKIAFSSHTG
ncbi:MAG TPA: MASE1 domain-containing protein [Candidatus Saccharimonadales bacterium]|nr:MASE1 domain-containing protein [Candidatus Saccharimonadales bacterium]